MTAEEVLEWLYSEASRSDSGRLIAQGTGIGLRINTAGHGVITCAADTHGVTLAEAFTKVRTEVERVRGL